MDDEFEIALRIDQLDKACSIASTALRRAQLNLQAAHDNPTMTPIQVARAEKRCDELVLRHANLRRMLNHLEDQTSHTA